MAREKREHPQSVIRQYHKRYCCSISGPLINSADPFIHPTVLCSHSPNSVGHSVKGGMRNGMERNMERNMERIAHAQYIDESAKMPHVLNFI